MATGQMNLRDVAKGLKDDTAAGITSTFFRRSLLMDMLPFVEVNGYWRKKWLVDSLSDANFRQFGNSFTTVKDNVRDAVDSVVLLGGQIDIDMALREGGETEEDLYAANLAWQPDRFRYTFLDKFINGDRDNSTDEFNGLWKRTDDFVADGHTDATINGSNIDVSASSANRQTFLDHLADGIDRIDADGDEIGANAIITGRAGYLTIASVARREGLLDTTKDSFDRTINKFAGIPFVRIGTKADQSTQIITATESDDGTSSTGADNTSFYICKFGDPYVAGLQFGAPAVPLDRLIDDGVTHRVVFQWKVGLQAFHKRSVVRLFAIDPLFN